MRDKTLLLMICFSASLMLLLHMSEGSTADVSYDMDSEPIADAMGGDPVGGDVVDDDGCAMPVECRDTTLVLNELSQEVSDLALDVYEFHQREMMLRGIDVAK